MTRDVELGQFWGAEVAEGGYCRRKFVTSVTRPPAIVTSATHLSL